MAATTTTLFQHAHVQARMIVEPKRPRFEITVGGEVAQSFPATRRWVSESKLVVAAARERLALDGVELPAEPEKPATVTVARDGRMAARLHPVTSSFMSQVGYSASRRELTVVFKTGKVFIYTAVTMAEFVKILRAPSAGKAYHATIRGKKAGFELEALAA